MTAVFWVLFTSEYAAKEMLNLTLVLIVIVFANSIIRIFCVKQKYFVFLDLKQLEIKSKFNLAR